MPHPSDSSSPEAHACKLTHPDHNQMRTDRHHRDWDDDGETDIEDLLVLIALWRLYP